MNNLFAVLVLFRSALESFFSITYQSKRGRAISRATNGLSPSKKTSSKKMGNCTTSEAQRAADATLASARAKEAYRHKKAEKDAAQAIVDKHNRERADDQKVEDDSVRENTVKIQEAIKAWMKPLNHEKNSSLDDTFAASHLCYLQLPGRNMDWQVVRRLRSQKFDLIVSIGWCEKEGRTVARVYHGWCPCCPSFCLEMPPQ